MASGLPIHAQTQCSLLWLRGPGNWIEVVGRALLTSANLALCDRLADSGAQGELGQGVYGRDEVVMVSPRSIDICPQ